jgi:hypothetical protein
MPYPLSLPHSTTCRQERKNKPPAAIVPWLCRHLPSTACQDSHPVPPPCFGHACRRPTLPRIAPGAPPVHPFLQFCSLASPILPNRCCVVGSWTRLDRHHRVAQPRGSGRRRWCRIPQSGAAVLERDSSLFIVANPFADIIADTKPSWMCLWAAVWALPNRALWNCEGGWTMRSKSSFQECPTIFVALLLWYCW